MKKIRLEVVIKIIMAILFLNYPIVGFPAMALTILISTIINKNQVPIVGVYCEIPKDKYEVINENQFHTAIKIRGYSLFLLIFTGWLLLIICNNLSSIFVLLTIIFSIFHLFISNLILEKYYKLKDIKG